MLVYTGGTDFSQILEEMPELKKFGYRIDTYSFDPVIDSSDVDIEFWKRLTRLIEEHYDSYDGFVILHGTDTMSFSASALSFMLGDTSRSRSYSPAASFPSGCCAPTARRTSSPP